MTPNFSLLRRLSGESWHDALIFQASEAGGIPLADTADDLYNHYITIGCPSEDAARIVADELALPLRTVEGLLP